MSRYLVHIPRRTRIKTNGTQCGSPALRGRRFCFVHKNWQGQRISVNAKLPVSAETFTLPFLKEANSIQISFMQVIQLLFARQIDPKTAGLLLYALQTASLNLKHTDLEPRSPERVIIDPSGVHETAVGENPWRFGDLEERQEDDADDADGDEEDSEEDEELADDDDADEEEEDEDEDEDEEDGEEDDDDDDEDEEDDDDPDRLYLKRERPQGDHAREGGGRSGPRLRREEFGVTRGTAGLQHAL